MKKLSYAYASSIEAKKYNKGWGCWIVEDDNMPPQIYPDTDKFTALAAFEAIKAPYNPFESFDRGSPCFQGYQEFEN